MSIQGGTRTEPNRQFMLMDRQSYRHPVESTCDGKILCLLSEQAPLEPFQPNPKNGSGAQRAARFAQAYRLFIPAQVSTPWMSLDKPTVHVRQCSCAGQDCAYAWIRQSARWFVLCTWCTTCDGKEEDYCPDCSNTFWVPLMDPESINVVLVAKSPDKDLPNFIGALHPEGTDDIKAHPLRQVRQGIAIPDLEHSLDPPDNFLHDPLDPNMVG